MSIKDRRPENLLLAAIFVLSPLTSGAQPILDAQTFSEQGSLLEIGPHQLLSVGGQTLVTNASQDSTTLEPGFLNTLTSLPLVSKPLAAIHSPSGMGIRSIINGAVTVMGIIESTSLKEYKLEFARGLNGTSNFTAISSGTANVSGALAVWSTEGLSGFYTLRLSAADTSGGSMISTVNVYIGQPVTAMTFEGLQKPEGTSSGSDGRVYVADTHNDRIAVFTSTAGNWRSFEGFHKPCSVAVDALANIFVADTQNDRVIKMAPDGQILQSIGRSSKKSELDKPRGIAITADGRLYVADAGNRSIKLFSSDAALLKTIPLPNGGKPTGIAIDGDGRIYASDEKANQVYQYDSSGSYIRQFGDGLLKNPQGVAVDPGGDALYVSDNGNSRIARFDRFGNLQATFTGIGKAAGLALTTSGDLLVADPQNDRILQLTLPDLAPTALAGRSRGYGRAEGRLRRDRAGKVHRADGTGVEVPIGALTADMNITVDRAPGNQDEHIKRARRQERQVLAVSEEIEFGPEGTVFNSPVTLIIAYNPAQVAARGLDENELIISYWNRALSNWEPLPSIVDKQSKTVSALTNHFSGYQVQGVGTTAAIDEFSLREAFAFPNPTRGNGTVTLRIQTGLADSVEVHIYDLSGRRIHSSSDFRFSVVGGENTYDHPWDVSGVGSGIYAFVMRARKSGQADIIKAGKIGVIK